MGTIPVLPHVDVVAFYDHGRIEGIGTIYVLESSNPEMDVVELLRRTVEEVTNREVSRQRPVKIGFY